MLDEVDKIGADFRGDPVVGAARGARPRAEQLVPRPLPRCALRSVQGHVHHHGQPHGHHPAGRCATGWRSSSCPGYTEEEKLQIAKRYLVPRQLTENGLSRQDSKYLATRRIHEIITHYTREAGVRNLEREIGADLPQGRPDIAEGQARRQKSPGDRRTTCPQYLGLPQVFLDRARAHGHEVGRRHRSGLDPGRRRDPLHRGDRDARARANLMLTGQLGDVMKESAQAGLSLRPVPAPASSGIDKPTSTRQNDIHIHVPAGAIPKDGPSAGITMATALISPLHATPVRKDVAMTGEITLRGHGAARSAGSRRRSWRPTARDQDGDPARAEREGPGRDPGRSSGIMEFIYVEDINEVLSGTPWPAFREIPRQGEARPDERIKTRKLGERELLALVRRHFSVPAGTSSSESGMMRPSSIRAGESSSSPTISSSGFRFHLPLQDPRLLGRKSLNVNLSDVAAMGGRRSYSVLALGLPNDISLDWVVEFFSGFKAAGRESGTVLVGGDISQASKVLISVTVIGKAAARSSEWGPAGRQGFRFRRSRRRQAGA